MQEHEQLRLHEEGQQEQKLQDKMIKLHEQKTQGQELQKKEQEEPRKSLVALKRAHKTLEEANKQKEQELAKLKKVMKNVMELEEKKPPNIDIFSNKA